MNRPEMTEGTPDRARTRMSKVTGINERFDRRFDGGPTDQNLFARIVRSDLPRWHI